MLDITGAGAQPPMRSHWKLRPGPQSYKNREQQCKRYRANTASSNASAAEQTQSQQTAKTSYKANGRATATCIPVPPQAHTLALCRPKCLRVAAGRKKERQQYADLLRSHSAPPISACLCTIVVRCSGLVVQDPSVIAPSSLSPPSFSRTVPPRTLSSRS